MTTLKDIWTVWVCPHGHKFSIPDELDIGLWMECPVCGAIAAAHDQEIGIIEFGEDDIG